MANETTIATSAEGPIVRPLNVLIPLIHKDLEKATEAGMPFYRAAGEKMLEAKCQMKHGDFGPWLKRHFKVSSTQARLYMSLVRTTRKIQTDAQEDFSSLHQFRVSRGQRQTVYPSTWHEGVKESVERAKREAERIREENLTRQQEREAEQKLAHRLIEIGFKVLAKELHPDKGGSRDAMARLNRVRTRLKQCA